MKKILKKYGVYLALIASIGLYIGERSLPTVEKEHRVDLNNDGRNDLIMEKGYSFYPRYEVFINTDQGPVRNTTFSRDEISSKLNK